MLVFMYDMGKSLPGAGKAPVNGWTGVIFFKGMCFGGKFGDSWR